MEIFIMILVFLGAFVAYSVYTSSKRQRETIVRRKRFVESISPTARIIVNNGIHLFFKDDAQQMFGLDESGKTYSFAGLQCVNTYKDSIGFFHKDSVSLCVGKDVLRRDATVFLDRFSIEKIEGEMLPVLRKNLYEELDKHGVSPTHEYVHDGEFWGCDINAKKFYNTYGSIQIFDFSDLRRVTVEDLTKNTLYDGSYIIHVFVKSDFDWGDNEFEIHFKSADTTFYNLLAMFKGIQNRK